MKLEVGMYVRFKGGFIDKIISFKSTISNDYVELEDECYANKKNILKASHNIIDLIEVGDVISTNNLCGQVTSVNGDKIYTTCYDGECCYDYQIQSIVTKEQFSSMEYRLGE